MSSAARVKSSRQNGARSRGPLSAQTKAKSSMNSLRDGFRAAPGRVLRGESRAELEALTERWVLKLQPRDGAEADLVTDVVNARWMLRRAEGAHFDFLDARDEHSGLREESRVAKLMIRLTWDRRGSICTYGLTNCTDGTPGTSSLDSPDDPNEPSELVRQLEACPRGCEVLIENWQSLGARLRDGLPWQGHDRLLATRLLGRQPTDIARDERVNVIFLASFALHPQDRGDAYEALQSDLGTLELKAFLKSVRSRGPRVVDAGNPAAAKQALVDLVDRAILRLQAKLELHQQLAKEKSASPSAPLTPVEAQELERLRRFELACQRRVHRCEDAFWKHRRQTESLKDGGWSADEVVGEEQTEENFSDLSTQVGAPGEVPIAPNENLTNEPRLDGGAPETGTLKEVASLGETLGRAAADLRALHEMEKNAFPVRPESGAKGRAAIEEAVFARGPLLRPIS
jgi:hypothetical protein